MLVLSIKPSIVAHVLTCHKLKYIYERPRYLTTCVFGIAFILLGNVATNSISFGMSVLDAAGKDKIEHHDEIVRAIAVAAATFSCLIHGVWRQGGIYLNNFLAVLKITILLMMFILGLLAHAGVFGETNGAIKTNTAFCMYMLTPHMPIPRSTHGIGVSPLCEWIIC